ncbi:MAG: hypothetical protein VKJ44_06815 [Synechococcus sp.]|nr:hypothetical protein [Synechococcus sp.]
MALSQMPPACRESLQRAGSLLEVRGSYALRSQAQQQAALELLQARRLGATDPQLAEVLQTAVDTSVAGVLRHSAMAMGPAPALPEAGAGLERRLTLFLQAEAEGLPVPADAGADRA